MGSNPTQPCTTPCSMENNKVALAVSAPSSCATAKQQASDGEERATSRVSTATTNHRPHLTTGHHAHQRYHMTIFYGCDRRPFQIQRHDGCLLNHN